MSQSSASTGVSMRRAPDAAGDPDRVDPIIAPGWQESPLMLVWVELDPFENAVGQLADIDIAETLDDYYRRVARVVVDTGGRVVTYAGPRVLVVFNQDRVDGCVRVLADLKGGVDAMLESRGVRARMHARAHFGVVIAGEFGPDGARHFDVVGKAVQAVSLLDRSGITLSLAAMRKLGAESRTRFSRHSAPLGAGGILPGIGIGLFGFLAFFLGGTLLTDRLPNPPAAFEAAGVASPIAPETAGAAPDPAGSGTGDAPPDLSGATQPPVSGPSAFTVQVGAFAEPANAEGLQSALAARGHEAYRVELDRGGAPLTMVRVGGFASRAEASDAAADLSDDGLPTFVVRSGAR